MSGRLFKRSFGPGWLLAGASPKKLLYFLVEPGDIYFLRFEPNNPSPKRRRVSPLAKSILQCSHD